MRELFEDLKLNKIAYLLEQIEKGNYEKKVKTFKKLEKYKITKKIGIYLIENSTRNYNFDDELGGINSSIIELCFKNYYDEYADKIREIFKKLSANSQDRVLYLLTTVNNISALNLYTDLIIKYYKDRSFPIGELIKKPNTCSYIFPKLFKILKSDIVKNDLLILLNNYIEYKTIDLSVVKKNKKLVQDSICKIFDEALKFKFKNSYEGLNNAEYRSLRYYLEIAVNLESYVSNKKTSEFISKLLKKNDNQIKLFIIDSYIKNNKKIDNINFNPIAKDLASRYALFELLYIYDRLDLMPKKYLNQKLLAQSDLYTNFVIEVSYTNEPVDLEFYKKISFNNLDYYVFKFRYKYKYNSFKADYLTNYICNQVGIEKYNNEEIEADFIGISGAYDPNTKTSVVIKKMKKLSCFKLDFDDEESINTMVLGLIMEDNKHDEIMIDIKKEKLNKQKSESKIRKSILKLKKIIKKFLTKFKKFIRSFENKKRKDNVIKKIFRKIKTNKFSNDEIHYEDDITDKKIDVISKKHHIFSYVILFLFAIFLSLLIYWMLYVYGVGSMNDGFEDKVYSKATLISKEKFTEILGSDIYNQSEDEYFVLLYNAAIDKSDKYYTYINEYLKREIKFYFVDLKKEENKFLFDANDLNFVINCDRLLKVKDHDYEYYVDGKIHILNEMENQINSIKEKEKKESSVKIKIEKKKTDKKTKKKSKK